MTIDIQIVKGGFAGSDGMGVEVYYDQTARVEACALDGSSHRIKKSKDETVATGLGLA